MNDETYQSLRLVHYAARLPVHLLEEGQIRFSLPHGIHWIGSILSMPNPLETLQPPQEREPVVLHLNNDYLEHYVYWEPQAGTAILVGPYAAAPYEEADGLRMIRDRQLPLRYHKAVLAYLSTLPALTTANAFYVGKLVEQHLTKDQLAKEHPENPDPAQDVEAPYYQNAYANRMALFHHPPLFFEQELSRQITAGNPENARRVLLELNTLSRARLADSPLRSLKNSLICSVTLFTRAAIEGGVPVDEAFTLSDTCIQAIEQMTDSRSLTPFEEEIVNKFVSRVARYQSQRYSAAVQRSVRYIDDHLAEKLTLSAIAAYAYVHPDYLSARFHRETGATVTEFIQKRRVEESAHFLRYGESSVSEIAAFYQFCSQSYYIQVFKKYMGVTPVAYRAGERARLEDSNRSGH
jgi:YesN/AraC family two-component response regulator